MMTTVKTVNSADAPLMSTTDGWAKTAEVM